jgi:hypothetical protein
VLEPANESLRILQKAAAATRIEPLIPLGSVGKFVGQDWTVIGFQQRVITAEGKDYPWQEYLLHHPEEGFRWLVESTGHWSWVSPLAKPPRYSNGQPTAIHGDQEFTRFAAGSAVTRYVIGEFTWKVRVGETWETIDFVAPPKMLSRESGRNETTWSLGEYLPAEEVAAAFKLPKALPDATGIGMIQPNPRRESHRRVCGMFWKFAALAVLAQLLWIFILGGRTLLDQRLVFSPQNDEPVTTQTFQLDGNARNLVLRHDTDLDNNWLGLGLTLIEKESGKAWLAQTEIAYWHGSTAAKAGARATASRNWNSATCRPATITSSSTRRFPPRSPSASPPASRSSATRRRGATSSSC